MNNEEQPTLMKKRWDEAVKVFKDEKTGKVRVMTINREPSKTMQADAEAADINNIMKNHLSGASIEHLRRGGVYGDFSEIKDYREMLDTVRYADEAFSKLPAEMRKRFRNDPAELLEFLQDPKNKEEAIKLGLIDQPATPTPSESTSVPKASAPATEPSKADSKK